MSVCVSWIHNRKTTFMVLYYCDASTEVVLVSIYDIVYTWILIYRVALESSCFHLRLFGNFLFLPTFSVTNAKLVWICCSPK